MLGKIKLRNLFLQYDGRTFNSSTAILFSWMMFITLAIIDNFGILIAFRLGLESIIRNREFKLSQALCKS